MSCVYRYTDVRTMKRVYVGKTSNITPEERIRQHMGDRWFKEIGKNNLLIEYIDCLSDAEADILETHYISVCSILGSLENKAKLWGASAVVSTTQFVWKTYGSAHNVADEIRGRINELVDGILNSVDRFEETKGKTNICLKYYYDKFDEYVRQIQLANRYKYELHMLDVMEQFASILVSDEINRLRSEKGSDWVFDIDKIREETANTIQEKLGYFVRR